MKLFDSELQYLSELYSRLAAELSRLNCAAGKASSAALAESILKNRELFSRIEKMNSRVAQLSREWEKLRQHMDPASQKRTREIAETVAKQSVEVSRSVDRHAQALAERKVEIEKQLEELQQGARYLASVKPAAVNYPKFIDSVG
jgi:prefoldin subunit 5